MPLDSHLIEMKSRFLADIRMEGSLSQAIVLLKGGLHLTELCLLLQRPPG
jgi:hypothetical protein